MSKQKLWIVSELFYPDQTSTSYIMSMIANAFVDKYDVHVITDFGFYQANKQNSETYYTINNKLIITRVKTRNYDKNKLSQRIIKLIFLSLKFSKLVWKNVQKEDKVFVVTNPAPFLILASILKKIRKFDLYILVHDVFPENTIPAGLVKNNKSLTFKFLSTIYNKAYSNANFLIVLGRDMKAIVHKKINSYRSKPEVRIIENWGDVISINPSDSLPKIIRKRHENEIISIQYAGNIGRVQGLQRFINLINISTNKKIFFDIWGDGAIKTELEELVFNFDLQKRISFNGIYSRSEQNSILNSTDIALVTLTTGMYGLGVPSKTYNILAAGKPILYIGDLQSEIALMITEEQIGYCFKAEDNEGLLNFLNNLSIIDLDVLQAMGLRARKLVEEKYSEKVILDKFISLI